MNEKDTIPDDDVCLSISLCCRLFLQEDEYYYSMQRFFCCGRASGRAFLLNKDPMICGSEWEVDGCKRPLEYDAAAPPPSLWIPFRHSREWIHLFFIYQFLKNIQNK